RIVGDQYEVQPGPLVPRLGEQLRRVLAQKLAEVRAVLHLDRNQSMQLALTVAALRTPPGEEVRQELVRTLLHQSADVALAPDARDAVASEVQDVLHERLGDPALQVSEVHAASPTGKSCRRRARTRRTGTS